MSANTNIWYIIASGDTGGWSVAELNNLTDTLTSNGATVIQGCFVDSLPMQMSLPIRRNIDRSFDELARRSAGFLTFGDIRMDMYNTPRIDLNHPDNSDPLSVLNAVVKQLERQVPDVTVMPIHQAPLPKVNNTIFTITRTTIMELIKQDKLFTALPGLESSRNLINDCYVGYNDTLAKLTNGGCKGCKARRVQRDADKFSKRIFVSVLSLLQVITVEQKQNLLTVLKASFNLEGVKIVYCHLFGELIANADNT